MPLETERKFLLRLDDVVQFVSPQAERLLIEQAYIVGGPQGILRIRCKRAARSESFLLTCKGPKNSGSAEEIEFPISQERYAALVGALIGRPIRKTRLIFPIGAHIAEIDIFDDALAPLCMAEVEGPNCTAFVPPAWFGREVTGDPRYDNASLALTSELPPIL